ncbi:hypothetical protein HK102_007507, partial [Quaeritorhiza haematococci]
MIAAEEQPCSGREPVSTEGAGSRGNGRRGWREGLKELMTVEAWLGDYDYAHLCIPNLPCLRRSKPRARKHRPAAVRRPHTPTAPPTTDIHDTNLDSDSNPATTPNDSNINIAYETSKKTSKAPRFFGLHDRIPILLAALMGFQHALAMLAG